MKKQTAIRPDYKISDDELNKIHEIQVEMLLEVDRICKKCGIKYSIIAGTLLGAVRHGGFIPWDDDADVAMLREEYEKFREACKTEMDKTRFVFQDHRNTKGYRWGYGKIRRKDTLFLRSFQENMPYFQGIFIDVFPLDGVPDNYLLRSFQNFQCFLIRKTLWSEVGKLADKNFIKRKTYAMISHIPLKAVFRRYSSLIRKSNRRKTKMVRILLFPTPNREWGYYRCWYETTGEYEFEGKTFKGIRDYDSYLSFKFGDYRTLPPLEQRKVHPVTKLKLI